MAGIVHLLGAGPGDPELLTLKAARLLAAADAVLHDSLIAPEILALAPPRALMIDVGKRCGGRSTAQGAINKLLVAEALRGGGRRVVRLKGGDPGIFGRANEEIAVLREAGIAYEIVPGITAASAAAASLGQSLTARGIARGLHIITGHGAEGGLPAQEWAAIARAGGTLAVYMGSRTAPALVRRLMAAGLPADLPGVAVESASLPAQRITRATLAGLPAVLADAGAGPVLLLVGAAMAEPAAARAALSDIEILPA